MMLGIHDRMAGPTFVMTWYFVVLMSSVIATEVNSIPEHGEECEVAQAKCALRSTCYMGLHAYMVDCADILAGRTTKCHLACKRALISLTSSEAGEALSNCHCGDNEFCLRSKERIEVCRPEVSYAIADDTIVPCSVAQWICTSDPLCSTALDYYHRFCRHLFLGQKCTHRCNNSLAILDRQVKARKLRDCFCDGSEDFPCINIKRNTQRFCYGQEWINNEIFVSTTTERTLDSSSSVTLPTTLLFYLIASVVVWYSYRTSEGNVNTSNTHQIKNKTIETSQCVCSGQVQRLFTKDIDCWPWWWTSEQQTI